jgi:hypothetical protein
MKVLDRAALYHQSYFIYIYIYIYIYMYKIIKHWNVNYTTGIKIMTQNYIPYYLQMTKLPSQIQKVIYREDYMLYTKHYKH